MHDACIVVLACGHFVKLSISSLPIRQGAFFMHGREQLPVNDEIQL